METPPFMIDLGEKKRPHVATEPFFIMVNFWEIIPKWPNILGQWNIIIYPD